MNGIKLTQDQSLDLTRPSSRWLVMTHEDRCTCLSRVIALRTEGISLLSLDKITHVVVRVDRPKRDWPVILRELESLLKRDVERSLQVYVEPRKDDSLLRLGRLEKDA